MLRARARAVPRGEWVYTLGGWTIDQFADDKKPFTREELDQVAPDNPVLLQASYFEAYLNSRALQILGIDEKTPAAAWVVRDASGKPTGRIGEAGFRGLVAKLPEGTPNEVEASTVAMIRSESRGAHGVRRRGCGGCVASVRRWATRVS
jgi:predicted amidohydrolase YtcJ